MPIRGLFPVELPSIKLALTFGSHATGICEPCQGRNAAALSRSFLCGREGAWAELTVEVTSCGCIPTCGAHKKEEIIPGSESALIRVFS